MNREKIYGLLDELKEAHKASFIPEGSNLTLEFLDEIITRLELRLEDLEKEVIETNKVSPNPWKQERRYLKSKVRKLTERRDKMVEHRVQFSTHGKRNSYSKTDTDATFMRVKDDHIQNGQLKPAYNLQIATCNQFVLGYDIYQNPTDTKTLIPFLKRMGIENQSPKYIVTDAGYGSESNYRYLEDNLSEHTPLIPYSTMLKENSKKWKSDERKVSNWHYNEKDDFYIDLFGVRFNFSAHRQRTDKDGFVRHLKEYKAEKYDINEELISRSLTKTGRVRKILVNPELEYFKAKQKTLLSSKETTSIYARRKIDVETVFGQMKAYLNFNQFMLRGIDKVRKETGIVIMALNIHKLAVRARNG